MQPRTMPDSKGDTETCLLGDGGTLRDILMLAGPDIAPRLLAQITADLTQTANQLRPALAQRDWPLIRAQTHVLISVAGTIGAMGLHAEACRLNTAAHLRDEAQTAALAPALMDDLSRLIALIDALGTAP
ncbi:hypothetical protein HYN69_13380 [Gemmobacter aquarius]|uniref:Hpt domain-containing protein n=1 Tax=Paragemmobacter aquarius TaxID=2169400 RepID=A0A2S0UNG5_9RHOB|nr:hypothetical protein [Gemmobacter aquarius]AWB49359.1 hypothetical protein HYN69_13380 [Gemmobacter aquarius]